MGSVNYKCDYDRTGEQKALGRIKVQNCIVQNLEACGFLYQARDDIDEEKVDGQGGPDVVPFHFH